MSITAQRVAEFNSLIETYARVIQMERCGTEVDVEEQERRRTRLDELADLLNTTQSAFAERYSVVEAVERWIAAHPLMLTGSGMQRVIDQTTGQGNGISVGVRIGSVDSRSSRYYPLHEGMFITQGESLLLSLPESVAEEFRQQGRRALQREYAALMAVESYR